MLNLKNKPLATGYFTKKSFSLLTVAIIGYLLTPAASANSYCFYVGTSYILNTVFFFDRDNRSPVNELVSSGSIMISCTVDPSIKNIDLELVVKNSTLVPDHSHVYTTNVPGLGIHYNLEPGSGCVKDTAHPLKFSCSGRGVRDILFGIKPKVTLIHYGNNQSKPVGNASVNPLFGFEYRIDNGQKKSASALLSSAINFKYKRRGCTLNTPEVKLNFGKVQASEFSGVKSTSQPSTADKIYLNCDPDTSYFLTIQGKSV
ncbi:hypothetical protein LNQ47_10290, partial [Yersinia ruckeri]|nr:hypothetical protein [Yersinia ruckeri]